MNESRLGLIANGILKVPMQFFILLTGVMVFVFYQINGSPLFFNRPIEEKVLQTSLANTYKEKQASLNLVFDQKKIIQQDLLHQSIADPVLKNKPGPYPIAKNYRLHHAQLLNRHWPEVMLHLTNF